MNARTMGATRRMAVVVGALLLASPLWSQEPPAGPPPPASNFVELMARIGRGDRISVTDIRGRQVEGRLRDLSPASLTLDGTVFEVDEVQSVDRKAGRKIGRETIRGLSTGSVAAFAVVTRGGYSTTASAKTIAGAMRTRS